MASAKYTYSVSNDFPNSAVESTALTSQIQASSITRVLDYINTSVDDCDIWFLDILTAEDITTLSGVVAAHDGTALPVTTAPTMADGRPIVMSNSRPVGYQTIFTMAGDTASGIGDGKEIVWDFSNDDDLMASGIAPAGYKGKCLKINFLDPVYVKEGTIYFHGAKKGSYMNFNIICPNGQYYLNRDGTPAQANGDVTVVRYVNKHHFYGDCPMGDELNTESATENAIPENYKLCVEVFVPDTDNDSYGYGELELYRSRTVLLPGESV